MTRRPKVSLRALEPADVKRLYRCVNDPRVNEHQPSFRLPHSLADERAFYERVRRSRRDLVLSITSPSGRWLGVAGVHDVDWVDRRGELGVLVADPRDWGRGVAAAAVRQTVKLAFETLNLHRLEVPVLMRHRVARAMYERLGFTAEGVLRDRRFLDGAHEDVVMLSLLSTDAT